MPVGKCLRFEGTNEFLRVDVQPGNLPLTNAARSVCMMVKPTTVVGGTIYCLLSYGIFTFNQLFQLHIWTNGKLSLSNYGQSVDAPLTLSVGVWHCIIVTYNPANGAGLKYKIYIDDMVTAVASGDMATDTRLGLFHIGADISGAGGGAYFIGMMDEFRMYDKELSQAERVAYRDNGVGLYGVADVTNGVIAYHLDQSSGSAVADYQQLNNSGSLQNMEDADWVAGIVRLPGVREGSLASMGVGG